jgi:hypothetical protein
MQTTFSHLILTDTGSILADHMLLHHLDLRWEGAALEAGGLCYRRTEPCDNVDGREESDVSN